MPKRRVRSWDRRGIGRCDDNDEEESSASREPIPKITVDHVDFWSDRFYLCRPAELEGSTDSNTCTCGARCSPPLVDRARLVQSLQLEAAILATYTLDPGWMVEELPSLFNGKVPTLVMHGTKGFGGTSSTRKSLTLANGATSSKSTGDSSDEEIDSEPTYPNTTPPMVASMMQVSSNDIATNGLNDGVNGVTITKLEVDEPPPEEGWLNMETDRTGLETIHVQSNVHVTEILTTWLPPCTGSGHVDAHDKQSSTKSSDSEAACGVDPTIVRCRKPKRGVHHPKYMILFEKSGSVVVVVATGNLTKPKSSDACWMQRFGPATSKTKVSNEMRQDGSDFGYVLANYLERQSHAAKEGEMIPQAFMRQYLGIDSLGEFRRRYRFEESQVHLIATVPGDHPGRHSSTHLGKTTNNTRSFLYGPQRVADILHRLGPDCTSTSKDDAPTKSNGKPWLPRSVLSDQDRLIIQTTSFGGYWKRNNLAELVRSYYGMDDLQKARVNNDDAMLERADILWPTKELMEETITNYVKRHSQRKSPNSVSGISNSSLHVSSVPNDNPGFVFLSSKSFNTVDLPCISRMSKFEPSFPQQMPGTLRPPHIKSFCRMFEGNEYLLRQQYITSRAEECFSWVMLTSACLSRGAQGISVPDRGFESDDMTYSNFELGVMFVSRLQRTPNDRLYCWKPSRCVCGGNTKGASMIHLPLPYCLRPMPYQKDPEEAAMCSTPYFHEIAEGTGFVGQMTLTPFGAALAASRE